jgi:hypothetical protein
MLPNGVTIEEETAKDTMRMDPVEVQIGISATKIDSVKIINVVYENIIINSFKIDDVEVLSLPLSILSGDSRSITSANDILCTAGDRSSYTVYVNYTKEGMNDGYYFGTHEINLTCAN